MKKNLVFSTILLLAASICFFSFSNETVNGDFKYVGASKCKICHKGVKKGEIFKKWQNGPHAKAYETAKASEDYNEDCLKCHGTAVFNEKSEKNPPEVFAKSYKIEEGVSCEACHGPGSVYKKMSNMKSREKFLATGGIVSDEKSCLICHDNSFHKKPDYKFAFKERFEEIKHPVPAK